jgi:hypothetical protein
MNLCLVEVEASGSLVEEVPFVVVERARADEAVLQKASDVC